MFGKKRLDFFNAICEIYQGFNTFDVEAIHSSAAKGRLGPLLLSLAAPP
jgi:hypothetical protein